VTVTLHGFSHDGPYDAGVLLVGPTGATFSNESILFQRRCDRCRFSRPATKKRESMTTRCRA
jgi:hypothetical protein